MKRGESRVCESSSGDSHVPRSAQNRIADCSAYIDIQANFPVQLLEIWDKLTDEIHRAARETSFGRDRGFIGQFSGASNFWNIKRHVRSEFQRLNMSLLELPDDRQLIVDDLRGEIERRGLEMRPSLASQIAHLHIEPRVQVSDRPFRIELRIQNSRCHWFDVD